jgi:transcription termination/antitermination protein NusA
MELVVPDDQLSLAIGRRGQNVRLASQLTGWRLDVIGESKFKVLEEQAIAALASIENLDRNLALTLYKQGFRSLDEVAEAAEEELGAIEGLGGPANAASLKRRAESAMEKLRLGRIKRFANGDDVLGERDELLLIQGVTPRIADLLQHAGYRNLRDLSAEEDIDRLAIRTGLGSKRAQMIHEGVQHYQANDADRIVEGQHKARERQDAEQQAAHDARLAAAAAPAGTNTGNDPAPGGDSEARNQG